MHRFGRLLNWSKWQLISPVENVKKWFLAQTAVLAEADTEQIFDLAQNAVLR